MRHDIIYDMETIETYTTVTPTKVYRTFLYNKVGAVEDILNHYKNVTMTVTDLAIKWGTTPRSIQRLVKQHGIVRTVAEANKATSHLKDYSALRIPDHLKAKRIILKQSVRYAILSAQPWCTVCGRRPHEVALQVDHIDGDATHNDKSNLQVLCINCNQGKR